MTRAVGLVVALVIAGAAGEASAARLALVIGANRGDPDVPVLRFAERDAARMGEVLTRLGGVAPERLVVVTPGSAAELRAAFDGFGARVREAGPDALVIIYYSGHADQASLQIAGTRLPFGELKGLVRGLGARLTVMIVDACRSAGLITAKGGVPIAPFDLGLATPDVQGLAIVTSSSASEDAQESERLEGGVFTHHLLVGMQGAADASADGRVALTELYGYAYGQTRLATAGSPIEQHPAFAFDLRGEDDIVITSLEDPGARGGLALDGRGRWLVFDRGGGGRLAAELEVERVISLALAPGGYVVRHVVGPLAAERAVQVMPGLTQRVTPDALEAVPFRHGIRKGYGQTVRRAWSLGGALEVSAPLLDGTEPLAGIAVTGQLDLADLSIAPRLRFARAGYTGALEGSQALLGLDLGLYHLFDLGRHGLGFGVRVGVDWLMQRFADRHDVAPVDQLVPRVGPFVRAEWGLGASVALLLDVGADVHFVELEPSDPLSGGGPAYEARFVPTAALGFAFLVP